MNWWNPLNWLKLLSLAKAIYDALVAGYQWVRQWWIDRGQQEVIDGIHEIEQAISNANQTDDDAERLKEKADAACALEKAIDPNHKC